MEQVSPLGPVYQAGTLSGNPLGMAAGVATLRICEEEGFYDDLAQKSKRLTEGILGAATGADVPLQSGFCGGMFGFALSNTPVRNFDDAQTCDHDGYARFFTAMLERGVWLPPSGYEAMFVSAAHDDAAIDKVIAAAGESFRSLAS